MTCTRLHFDVRMATCHNPVAFCNSGHPSKQEDKKVAEQNICTLVEFLKTFKFPDDLLVYRGRTLNFPLSSIQKSLLTKLNCTGTYPRDLPKFCKVRFLVNRHLLFSVFVEFRYGFGELRSFVRRGEHDSQLCICSTQNRPGQI